MCILIDSREETPLVTALAAFDVPICQTFLDSGDCYFTGYGPSASPLAATVPYQIGIERKKLDDLCACIQSDRLSDQIRRMRSIYDKIYVLVEGSWRVSRGGSLEFASHFNGKYEWKPLYHRDGSGVSFRQMDSFLSSLSECGEVEVLYSHSVAHTAHLYISRWHWWQKPYNQHRSHDQLYIPDLTRQRRGKAILHTQDPSLAVLWAAAIPGMDSKAWDIGKQFNSAYDLAIADAERWRQVTWTANTKDGVADRHISKKRAEEIVAAVRSGRNGSQ